MIVSPLILISILMSDCNDFKFYDSSLDISIVVFEVSTGTSSTEDIILLFSKSSLLSTFDDSFGSTISMRRNSSPPFR